MQGARRGTPSQVSRITLWAEGCAKPLSHPGCPIFITDTRAAWLAQRFSAVFSPGREPGEAGSSPMSGFLHGACFSLCLCLCLSLSLCLSWINKNKNLKKNPQHFTFIYTHIYKCLIFIYVYDLELDLIMLKVCLIWAKLILSINQFQKSNSHFVSNWLPYYFEDYLDYLLLF